MPTNPASAATLASATIPSTPSTSGPIAAAERLQVLDILRGFAILVMFIVHFIEFSPGGAAAFSGLPMGGTMGAASFQAIKLFLVSKGWATFSILFGVGFAIQLRRADARGEEVRWRFLRRLLGIGALGVLSTSFSDLGGLVGYATSGVWLLFLRRWSVRALLIALLASATLLGIWNISVGCYQWATLGAERANAVFRSPHPISPARQAALDQLETWERWRRTGQGPHLNFPQRVAASFLTRVYGVRIADFWGDWQRGQAGQLLISMSGYGNFTLFLIGLLAVRLRVFDRPTEHRRLLFATMLVGAALWAIDMGQLQKYLWPWMPAIPVVRVAQPIRDFFIFGEGEGNYLALTYIAAITLLVAYSKTWEHRLAAIFGAAGRLALSNYLLQMVVLRILFDNYGFASRFTPQWAPMGGVLLFGALVAFSRWWLAHFRLGPAEWLLRSITYGRLQPLRRAAVQSV